MHFDEYFLPLSLFFRVAHVKGWLEILRAALLLAQPYCTLVLHDLPVRCVCLASSRPHAARQRPACAEEETIELALPVQWRHWDRQLLKL